MFEGDVTMCSDGWYPWYGALAPADVVEVVNDLATIDDDSAAAVLRRSGAVPEDDVAYALDYLGLAREFVEGLAVDERGMAYMIG